MLQKASKGMTSTGVALRLYLCNGLWLSCKSCHAVTRHSDVMWHHHWQCWRQYPLSSGDQLWHWNFLLIVLINEYPCHISIALLLGDSLTLSIMISSCLKLLYCIHCSSLPCKNPRKCLPLVLRILYTDSNPTTEKHSCVFK